MPQAAVAKQAQNIQLFSGYVHKVYIKHQLTSCLDLGPLPKNTSLYV